MAKQVGQKYAWWTSERKQASKLVQIAERPHLRYKMLADGGLLDYSFLTYIQLLITAVACGAMEQNGIEGWLLKDRDLVKEKEDVKRKLL